MRNNMPNSIPNRDTTQPSSSDEISSSDHFLEDYFITGSSESFQKFVGRNAKWMNEAAWFLVPASHVAKAESAEDLVQDSYVALMRARERNTGWIRGRASQRQWIKSIMRNRSISIFRRKKGPEIPMSDLAGHVKVDEGSDEYVDWMDTIVDDQGEQPFDMLQDTDAMDRVEQIMQGQSTFRRKLFHKVLREKKSNREIALELGISDATVSRGIKELCIAIRNWLRNE
jgi:RNA polymerase sigma factor (sigma-70 family)